MTLKIIFLTLLALSEATPDRTSANSSTSKPEINKPKILRYKISNFSQTLANITNPFITYNNSDILTNKSKENRPPKITRIYIKTKKRSSTKSTTPEHVTAPSFVLQTNEQNLQNEILPTPSALSINIYHGANAQVPINEYHNPNEEFHHNLIPKSKEENVSNNILDSTQMIIEKAATETKSHMSWKGNPIHEQYSLVRGNNFKTLSSNPVDRMDSNSKNIPGMRTYYPNLGFGVHASFRKPGQITSRNYPRVHYTRSHRHNNRIPQAQKIKRDYPLRTNGRSVVEIHPSVINTLQKHPRPRRPSKPFMLGSSSTMNQRVHPMRRPLRNILPPFMRNRKYMTMHKMQPPPPPGNHFSIIQSSLKNDQLVHKIPYRALHYPNRIRDVMKPLETRDKPSYTAKKPLNDIPKWMQNYKKSRPSYRRVPRPLPPPRFRPPPHHLPYRSPPYRKNNQKIQNSPREEVYQNAITTAIVRHIGNKPNSKNQKYQGTKENKDFNINDISDYKTDLDLKSSGSHFSVIKQKKPIEYLYYRGKKRSSGGYETIDDLSTSESVHHPSFIGNSYISMSQPLPKAILPTPNKVPESHASMLKNMRYGVNGEPLDVWIPLMKTNENKRIGRSQFIMNNNERSDEPNNKRTEDASQPLIFKEKENIFKTVETSYSSSFQKPQEPSFVKSQT